MTFAEYQEGKKYARLCGMKMSGDHQRGKKLRGILLGVLLALIVVSIGLAIFQNRPWTIPAAEKARLNPLRESEANYASAKEIYKENCANCHGASGKGDGSEAMMYDPAPSDLTDAPHMSKLSDGEIFYQITQGRKPMPSFRKKLTEEQRWQLVLLVRSMANTGEKK